MRYVPVLVFVANLLSPGVALRAQDKPNFVLILADDQGFTAWWCRNWSEPFLSLIDGDRQHLVRRAAITRVFESRI